MRIFLGCIFQILLVLSLPAQSTIKHQVIVLTDIEADPDDTQSLIRLLLYANEIDIQGFIATTSTHMRNQVHPASIKKVITGYGEVVDNLRLHDPNYPSPDTLLSVVKTGSPLYGMQGVGKDKDTPGSEWIIQKLQETNDHPLWISVWGGTNVLAQALFKLKSTQPAAVLKRLVAKLRVYTISDQDDSAHWIRENFPDLFYIVSPGGYGRSTWIGINQNISGIDNKTISNEWLAQNIQQNHGPLGALYPDVGYGMEGDTPAWLSLIPNGLNQPEQPDLGGWGGRYEWYQPEFSTFENSGFTGGVPILPETRSIWTNAVDRYMHYLPNSYGRSVRQDSMFISNQATIWRWRDDFQNDFAARMDWCLASYETANHPPLPALNHEDTLWVTSGKGFSLDATGSSDPDGDNLSYLWFHYPETGTYSQSIPIANAENLVKVYVVAPEVKERVSTQFIVKVTDKGSPALTRYRRVTVWIEP